MLCTDDRFRVIRDHTPQATPMLIGANSDALDVTGSECVTVVAQGAGHHRRVSQQLTVPGHQDVHATQSVQPIMSSETVSEGRPDQRLGGIQLGPGSAHRVRRSRHQSPGQNVTLTTRFCGTTRRLPHSQSTTSTPQHRLRHSRSSDSQTSSQSNWASHQIGALHRSSATSSMGCRAVPRRNREPRRPVATSNVSNRHGATGVTYRCGVRSCCRERALSRRGAGGPAGS